MVSVFWDNAVTAFEKTGRDQTAPFVINTVTTNIRPPHVQNNSQRVAP